MLSPFYRRFGFSSACYNVMLFVALLQRFVYVGEIQKGKADLISQIYQIMVFSMLKNWKRKYSSHYIIKFVGFMSICYGINMDIVPSCTVFSYLYPDLSIYCKFQSIILIFFSKKTHKEEVSENTFLCSLCFKKLVLRKFLKNMNQTCPLFSIGILKKLFLTYGI